MFVILCRRLASNSHLGKFPFKPLLSLRFLSSSSEISLNSNEQRSFQISYLINSCGLSPKSAKSACKNLAFKTPEKPDTVINFLRDNGFSGSQITEIVRKWPELLNAKVNKTILPKIEYLYSIGFKKENVTKFISKNPYFLKRSLKQFTFSCYDILKSLLHSEDKVVWVFERLHSYNLWRIQKFMAANVSMVRELGMPESFLSRLLLLNHEIFLVEVNKFNEAVKKTVEMGFDPLKFSFAQALVVQLQTSQKRWEAKINLFRNWGLSEDEFLLTFRRHQRWVLFSEDSIASKMSFLVNNMGWKPDIVVRTPVVFSLSLEKRIVPRCAVIRILLLKGLIKTEVNSSTFLLLSDNQFLSKFINHHLEKVPHLLDVLRGQIDMRELGFEFNDKQKASLV